MFPLGLNESSQNPTEINMIMLSARPNTSPILSKTDKNRFFQCGLWYGGSSIIMPAAVFPLYKDFLNRLYVIIKCKKATANKLSTIKIACAPKKVPLIKPTTPHVAPQGTTHESAIVIMRCCHESIILDPVTPPILQPKLTKNGMTALPCSPIFDIVLSNTYDTRAM